MPMRSPAGASDAKQVALNRQGEPDESGEKPKRRNEDGVGFDPTAVGFFEVRRRGSKTRCYDGLQAYYDRHRPLLGLLEFLVQPRSSRPDDRDEALLGELDADDGTA